MVLSGIHDLVSVNRAYSLGARTFLLKPCTVEDVRNMMRGFTRDLNQLGLQSFEQEGTNAPGSQAEAQ